jgi:hypothetical protein
VSGERAVLVSILAIEAAAARKPVKRIRPSAVDFEPDEREWRRVLTDSWATAEKQRASSQLVDPAQRARSPLLPGTSAATTTHPRRCKQSPKGLSDGVLAFRLLEALGQERGEELLSFLLRKL